MEWVWLTKYLKGMVKPAAALAVVAVVLSYFQRLRLQAKMGYFISVLLVTAGVTLQHREGGSRSGLCATAVSGLALEIYPNLVTKSSTTDGDEEVEAGNGYGRSRFVLAMMTGGARDDGRRREDEIGDLELKKAV